MLDETTAELLLLLTDVPSGEYLTELRGGVRVLWRISEGAPADEALEPAPAWMMLPAAA